MKNRTLFLLFFFLGLGLLAQNKQLDQLLNQIDEIKARDYFKADSLSHLAREQASLKGSAAQQCRAYYLSGRVAENFGFYEEAMEYFNQAKSLAIENQQRTLFLKTLYRISNVDLNNGEPEKAIESSINLYEIAVEEKDTNWIINSLIATAEFYRKIHRHEYALKYNDMALVYARTQADENYWGRIYNNLGATLGEMDRNKEAIDTLKRALKMISPENIYAQSKFISNIAFCYRNMGEYDSAIIYNKKSIQLKKASNKPVDLSYNEGAIGRAFIGLGQMDSALYYTLMAREHAKNLADPFRYKDATVHVAEAYYHAGDYKKAFEYLNESDGLSDSLFNDELKQKIELFQRKYDLTKKEREIEKLNTERQVAEAAFEQKITLLIGLILVLGLISVIATLIAKRRADANKNVALQLEMTQNEMKRNQEELNQFTRDLMQKNQAIRTMQETIQQKEQYIIELQNVKSDELQELSEIKILTDEDWTRFKVLFERVYPGFFKRMNTSEFSFTQGEKRLMALVKLDMNNREVADTLGISSDSVVKSRFRLKKKLNLSEDLSLDAFIHQL